MIVATLLSCACKEAPSESDAERYLRLLNDTTTQADTKLAECLEIEDLWLRGDCSLVIVSKATRGGNPLPWCQKLEAGLWRDECMFSAAESVAMRGNFDRARELCDHAGSFFLQCRAHAFNLFLSSKSDIDGDLSVVEQYYISMRSEWFSAVELESGSARATDRLFTAWFSMVLQARGEIEKDACSEVSLEHQQVCQRGLSDAENRLRH